MLLKCIGRIRKFACVFFTFYFLATGDLAQSQIYRQNFGTASINSHPYIATATSDAHLSGSSWSNSTGSWTSATGASGEAIRLTTSGNETITLTFQVAANFQASITSFSFWRQRNNTGPQNWQLAVNGVNIGTGTNPTTGTTTGITTVNNTISGLTGTVNVVMTLSGGTGNGTFRLDDFMLDGIITSTCTAAAITDFTPLSGPQNTLVTIKGSGFLAATAVKFNGIAANGFTIDSDSEIKAYIPAGNASGLISVTANACDGFSNLPFTVTMPIPVTNYSSDIYFSELYDAQAGDGGIIEIYNGTAAAVNLSGYSIKRYLNIGDASPDYTINLSGTILPGALFLVGIGTSAEPCSITSSQHYNTGFNANDEFKLYRNSTLIDNIHAPSNVGYTMIRKPNAVVPKAVFNSGDWTTSNTESCADIGNHTLPTATAPTVTSPLSKAACEGNSVSFLASIPAPAGAAFQWKVASDGLQNWTNVADDMYHSGATSSTLIITQVPGSYDKNQYYCEISSGGNILVSNAAQLEVNLKKIPTFAQVAAICSGGSLSALPTTSTNSITGSWSPALNNLATTTYVFTPNSGQCADVARMTILVNSTLIVPTFTQVAAICSGGSLSALPTTSTNNISGTWSPALNNLTTTTYVFTPNSGQCADVARMTISVNSTLIVPTFAQVAAICSGGSLSALPTTSTNSITGSWSPALNNLATTTYVFTPDSGQCADVARMTISVNSILIVPTFTQVAAICSGENLSALPTTSNNNITGTWSPAPNNLATTTYVFTPNSGQCADVARMTILVNSTLIVPTFAQIAAICSGGSLSVLPTISNNNISGTWSPALNNLTTTTYVFTPNSGQCADVARMTISVNSTLIVPTFTQVAAICSGGSLSALPTISTNNITGSWSPALNNLATTTYVFTPNSGQCADVARMTISVNSNLIVPTFAQVAAICPGGSLSALPTISNNNITGSWLPALNNLATTTYVFTPDSGQCADVGRMTISVNSTLIIPTFTQVAAICSGGSLSVLSTISNNNISGTWSPTLNNLATTTYVFTPNSGQCADVARMTISVTKPEEPKLVSTDFCIDPITGKFTNDLVLNSGIPDLSHTFEWFLNGAILSTTTNTHFAKVAGIYKVIVTNQRTGCVSEASCTLGILQPLHAISTVSEDFSNNQTITVYASEGSGQYSFQLNGGIFQQTSVFYNVPNGENNVVVKDANGCGMVNLLINVWNYPRFFTPNDDGYNDTWNIGNPKNSTQSLVYIFDRFGKLLKCMKPSDHGGWNGFYNGQSMPAADYWFQLLYLDSAGSEREFKSHFSLKR